VFGFDVHTISGHEAIDICSFHIEATPIPGHSTDSLVYRIGNLLFTGDTLLSGRIGTTPNAYARDLLIKAISRSLLPLPGETIILPGHGPPSLISAEKRFNPFLSGTYSTFPERNS
jgi:glyoxylase-like metal-dependent hydrolase (beta-lactamase superfamily II)